MFTEKELNALLKGQVINLAKYYGLDVNMRMLKGDVIEKILKYERKSEADSLPMSVRVQRIYESSQE
jgi:hypothetical protein